jgi:6-phosphogluconolactonase
MDLTKPMRLHQLPGPPGVDEQWKPIACRARSNVQALLCAVLCSMACGCGGGGGSASSGSGAGNTKCGNGYYTSNCLPPTPTTATLLAVTNATSGTIDMLRIDTTTGVPTPIAGNPLPDGPTAAAVAIDPKKRFLYVSSLSGELRGYVIDPSTLKLFAAMGSPFATSAEPVAIAVDPSGQFVVTANGSADTVSVFSIEDSSPCGGCYFQYGTLAGVQGSPHAAGADPSAIVATSQYVYAVNTAGHSVSVYRFDTQNDTGFGSLTPVAGSPFPTAGSPNGLVVDPTGAYLYTTESQPNEVSGFSIDGTNGSLTPISGSPFAASYALRSPVIDANGMRLHAANGTDVDCFLVASGTGALTEIGLSYTKGRAVALALDGPDGFLYALDNVDNQVEVFSIDPTDGSLTLIKGSPFALFPGAGTQSLGPNAIAVLH